MEDEAAEIELLEQNLKRTKQISQRMVSILTNFDTRLIKLEKSILPLHTATQMLTRRAEHIESTLQRIDEMSSNAEGVAVEEALILRGPQPAQLEVYADAMERLNASIAFKGSDPSSRETARLVETGTKKLSQLYTKLVAEYSSGAIPPSIPNTPFIPPEFPPNLLGTLQPLVSFLRTLPLPSTHPSHPASAAILSTLKDSQRGYANMRGTWSKKVLEGRTTRLLERVETLDAVKGGKEVGEWVRDVLNAAESEYGYLCDLVPLTSTTALTATYGTLLNPLLSLFSSTVSSLTSLIKRNLHRHTFLALSTYTALSSLQERWDDVVIRRSQKEPTGSSNSKAPNELKECLNILRGTCLRSFPEYLADLKMATISKGGEVNTSPADFTRNAVTYMKQLVQVEDAVCSALMALGDGNWRMGEGVQVGKAVKPGDMNERVVLEHYLYDVVTTLLNGLTALSRAQRRPAYGAIFLLNNVSFLRTHLLLEPENGIDKYIPSPAKAQLESNFRTAKAGYFDTNFSPLMQTLSDEDSRGGGGGGLVGGVGGANLKGVAGLKGGGASARAKEKFTRFFDLLEEVTDRHRIARVLPDDEEAREVVVEEVVRLVVPSLERFAQKSLEKEFSKNPQKYIKMSAEQVESQIRSLY